MRKAGPKRPYTRQLRERRAATGQEQTAAGTERPSSTQANQQAKSTLDFEHVSVHLVHELIFLAWIWTGMMLMGFGVAVAKMRLAFADFSQFTGSALQARVDQDTSPVTMGISFLVVGLLTILMSTYRYFTVQNQLRKQAYTHADNFVLIFVLALTFLSGTLIVLVLQMR